VIKVCGCGCGCGSESDDDYEEVIREDIMVPCKYCGTLFPQNVTTCPNCGAKRKAKSNLLIKAYFME
jgi:rubrerythrin